MSLRSSRRLAALPLLVALVVACAAPATTPSPTPASAASSTGTAATPKPAQANVVVGGPTLQPPQLGNLWVFVPGQQNLADEYSLKYEFQDSGNASNAIAAIDSNQIDFALITAATTFSAAARAKPAYKVILNSGINSDFVLLVNSDRIKSLKDLETATVATIQIGTTAYTQVLTLMNRSKLDPSKVKWYPTQTVVGQQTALIANQADATVVHIGEAQNAMRKAAEGGVKLSILLDADGLRTLAPTGGTVVIASEKILRERPDVVQRWVDASIKGMRLIANDEAKFYTTANTLQPGVNPADDLKTLYNIVKPILGVNGGLSTEPLRQVYDNWALFSDPKGAAGLPWEQVKANIDYRFVKSFLEREGVVNGALDVPDWR